MTYKNDSEHRIALSVVKCLKDKNGDDLIIAVAKFMVEYNMTANVKNVQKIPIS